MRVIVAQHLGLCFGVRDAIAAAQGVADPQTVTVLGELVHNAQVQADLRRRGFVTQAESERGRMPATDRVLITAHGISDQRRHSLRAAGKELIDTTCPLVRRAHRAALVLQAQGCFVVIIGKAGHVEVEGLSGDLSRFTVVETAAQVRSWGEPLLGVVCQTTTAAAEANVIRAAIAQANRTSQIRFVNTICKPTRDRQQAVQELIELVPALVVVGGSNSNNTRKLCEQAAAAGKPGYQVQSALDVDPRWAEQYEVMGLTAGTSTPDAAIRDVLHALRRLGDGRFNQLGALYSLRLSSYSP